METLLTILGSTVLGGLLVAVIGWLANKGKTRAETKKAAAEAIGKTLDNIEEEANMTITLAAEVRKVVARNSELSDEIDNANRRIASLEFQNHDQKGWIADVYTKLGACEEREKIGQKATAELKKELTDFREKIGEHDNITAMNKTLSDRTAQLTALVKKAHKEGFLTKVDLEAADI